MKRIENIGIIANTRKPSVKEVVGDCITLACQQGIRCFLEEKLKGICPEAGEFFPPRELVSRSDAIFTLGGDGTILFAARFTGPSASPLLGVNLGSLGFLAQIGPTQLEEALRRTLKGDYQLDRRITIEIVCRDKTFFALNEVVIEKGASSRVITLELWAGEQLVGSYIADGLIISTPTGSTAHSLAAGGPILHPQAQVSVVTPISPHSLAVRPLVFPVQTLFTVKLNTQGPQAIVVADGQRECQIQSGEQILVKKGPHTVDLIDFQEHSFYNLLRSRFKWGI
jgi:NAD+ kinase